MGGTDTAHFVFGILGDATGLLLFLAPLITFKRIVMNKSTEQFSGIPYVMTLLNCLLSAWLCTACLYFTKQHLVSTINGTGAAIEAIYVLIFVIYAPKKEKGKILGLLTFVCSVCSPRSPSSLCWSFKVKITKRSSVGFAAAYLLHHHVRVPFVDHAYMSVIVQRTVIKSKSVEYMPFFLSLFVFLCGTSWFIFGLLGKDPFVAVPNGFGSGLGAIQLILYAIYRDNKGEARNLVPMNRWRRALPTRYPTTACSPA
ncbi:hypothetical protein RHSIM_Rhsim10G0083800 [Rhododendron simsii]|uniref:Bidirectional sugar transporter SWEET n=1 Tax=Rhododendron simsii TaxID=118357 RepID=A0A834GBG5_RHOSS|nr:hypothetical protein RHSIM_Rhsim10G0083800 [Rhododendron simsii]